MASTPYEIRLELLKMSKDLLEQNFHTRRDTAMRQWELAVSAHKDGQEFLTEIPAYPSENEIINKAKLLNEFISDCLARKLIK
jgi:hypothetical protein